MVELLNHVAGLWWAWTASMFWQVGLLILLIGGTDRLIRKWAWPQLRYALWSLILVKLLLPPGWSLPSSVVQIDDLVGSVPVRAYSEETPDGVTTNTLDDTTRQRGAVLSSVVRLPSSIPFTWQFYAMMLWFSGTLILGIWLFLRLRSVADQQGYRAAAASLPPSFYNHLADCAKRLGLRRIPRVAVTKRLTNPAVFGVLSPVLLMPKGYLSKLSRRDTEHMLLHELAHIKRGDLVMHSLYMLLQIVYWYQPLLWLVRRHLHHLRELSCDGTVAELLRERTPAYRQMLLETARRMLARSVEPGLGLLGLFEDSNYLLVRLHWLTKPTWRYRTMKRTVVATVAVLMFVCVLPMAQARQRAPRDVDHSNHNVTVPVRTEGDSRQTQDQLSQEIAALQAKLAQLKAQQQDLQKQLEGLTGQSYRSQDDRRAPAVRREGARGRLPRERASGDRRVQGTASEPMAGRGVGAPGRSRVAGRDSTAPREPMAGRGGGAPGRPAVPGRDGAASRSREQFQRNQDAPHQDTHEATRARP